MDENKAKALQAALSAIEKTHGKGTVMILGDDSKKEIEHVSSGCLSLDKALGIGGYPKGRIVEIYGPESNGKTTVALHAIASAQKNGGMAAFIDAEHALDPSYAEKLGVDLNRLIISQPDNGEQAIDVAETLIASNAIDIIVVDSVAALVPKAEIEGEMTDNLVGLQARLMSKAMRKLAGVVNKSNCVAIFINQIREKIGVMYGNPETTSGGRALKFFASVRIEVRRIEDIKTGSDKTGVRTRAKIVKNKVAPPFKEAEFEIHYGKGISFEADLIEIALADEIIEKSGSWFTFKDKRFQGKENVRKAIEEDETFKNELVEAIKFKDSSNEQNTEE